MASITVTVGPCQVVFEDKSPRPSTKRAAVFAGIAQELLPDPDVTVVELQSAVERLVEDGYVDEDDVEDSARPSLGFRSKVKSDG